MMSTWPAVTPVLLLLPLLLLLLVPLLCWCKVLSCCRFFVILIIGSRIDLVICPRPGLESILGDVRVQRRKFDLCHDVFVELQLVRVGFFHLV